MVKECLIVRTSISSSLMKRSLLKGFSLAFFGVLGLLIGGIFISLPTLQVWGWSLFLFSLGLVTLGLFPYRYLSRLQLKPNELMSIDSDHLIYSSKGKKILTLPLQSVGQMHYIQSPDRYGIAVRLKSPPPVPVVIHECPQEVERLRQKGRQVGADLFFPYFSQRAYDELIEWQHEERLEYD